MSEIKFRINSVSSEHPKYPASNLTSEHRGWQSSINCQYPQSISISFYLPIRTKKVHLLFHQYKIPQLIDLYLKLGSSDNYKKLGYIRPSDNLQSSFVEKQEKTLYFQFQCTHILLVFYQNYPNQRNIFNQIGLEDLIVVGEVLNSRQILDIDLEESSEDEASQSIQIAQNFRNQSSRKIDVPAPNQYIREQTIKKKTQPIILPAEVAKPQQVKPPPQKKINNDERQIKPLRSAIEAKISEMEAQVESNNNEPKVAQLEPLDNKLRIKLEAYFSFIPQKIWQLCQDKKWKSKQQALKFVREKLNQIQTKQQFLGAIELISRIIVSKQAALSLDAIDLISKIADIPIKFTLQHMPFFVQDILTELLNFLGETNKQVRQLAYTTYLKLPQISFLGLNIVSKQITKHKSIGGDGKKQKKNDPRLIITKIQLMGALLQRYSQQQFSNKQVVVWILNYFEDPNQKVKCEASELLVTLTHLIGSEKVLKILQTNRPNMIESVLNMMNSSVDYSRIHNEQSKLSLQNSKLQQEFYGNESIKQTNKKSILQQKIQQKPIYVLESNQKLYKMQQSKSSRNYQNANVDLSYSKQSIYQQSIQPSQLKSQKQYIEASRRYQNQDDFSQLKQQKDQQIKVSDSFQEAGVCQYCLMEFQNEKNHYVLECKVLIFCDKCDSIIFIREFTDHLLNSCEQAHMYVSCKKCGLALELEESNEHIGRDLCRNKKGVNWERCQFCSEDILAEDKFWVKHAQQCRNLPQKPQKMIKDYQQR